MKTTKESILDIVYGVHAVTESLEANTGNKLYIQDDLRGKNVDAIKALAAEKKVSILVWIRMPSPGWVKVQTAL